MMVETFILLCRIVCMNEAELNSKAWDHEVERNNLWTTIVTEDEIEKARNGELNIWITPEHNVPSSWIEDIRGRNVLLLACGGGQQTPLLSAAGANVTDVDISPMQIEQDRKALEKYNLKADVRVGDMRDLSFLEDGSMDYVICPHSLNFISTLDEFYSESYRVLKKGGRFLFGAANPILYMFDEKCEARKLKVKYTIPYSADTSLSRKQKERKLRTNDTFEYSHTLDDIIGKALRKGFIMKDFYSDGSLIEIVDSFVHDSFLAFCMVKD